MKIGILHLSDIHLRKTDFDIEADRSLAHRISSAVRTELIGSTHVIVLVSGDIAFSGNEQEYNYAHDFLSEVYTQVADACSGTCWILCAPGNHDVDHSQSRAMRTLLVNQIAHNPELSTDAEIVSECTKEQDAFFRFQEEIEGKEILVYSDPLLRIHRIRDGSSIVQVNVLNSAWMSSRKERPGSLVFPIEHYRDQLTKPDGFSISVLHHPINWFVPENARRMRSELSQCSSVIVCGHEHMPERTRMLTDFNDHVRLIDGGVLKTSDSNDSSFNLVLLDTEGRKIKDFIFSYTGKRYEAKSSTDWEDATRLTSSESGRFRLRTRERSRIEEVGINLIHPRRERLSLRDIFVYPDLLPITDDVAKTQDRFERFVSAESLIFGTDWSHVILEGEEGAGKTALLRMLYFEFYNRGKIPLYLNGSQIKSGRDREFRGLLKRTFDTTYQGDDFTQFEQLDPSERILLVDDLDLSGKTEKHIDGTLQFIKKFFSRAILVTGDILSFQKLATYSEGERVLQDYTFLSIQEFGHAKRDELIKRWILLGRDDRDWNTLVTLNERDNARVVINTTIGRSLMPSYPFVVLVILQSRETGASSPIGSTYGHHYQYLITRSLIECGVRTEDLDAISNYISELAYDQFYSRDMKEISSSEYFSWHRDFCSAYGIEWDVNRVLARLQRGGIISIEHTGRVIFRYQYVYFFFLAKRLSSSLDKDDIRCKVKHMCRRLHLIEYSHIVLFLIHHSNDEFVLNAVRGAASSLLKEQEPFAFEIESDSSLTAAINRLPSAIGVQVLEDRDPDTEQEEALKRRDVVEANQRQLEDELSDIEEYRDATMDGLDAVGQLAVAAKTIELLGQTLRNYYGSLKIDAKVSMGRGALDLALRTLGVFFELLGQNHFDLVEFLMHTRRDYERKKLKSSSRKTDEQLERWARDLVFSIFREVGRMILKKVASALGSEQLRPTLQQLVPKNASIAYRLVQLAAALDGPTEIPRETIEGIARDLRNNPLAFQILRDLVALRVYRYPTEYGDKQWLSEKLNFSMKRQRSAELDVSRRIVPRQ